jgi:hypothetical protein
MRMHDPVVLSCGYEVKMVVTQDFPVVFTAHMRMELCVLCSRLTTVVGLCFLFAVHLTLLE